MAGSPRSPQPRPIPSPRGVPSASLRDLDSDCPYSRHRRVPKVPPLRRRHSGVSQPFARFLTRLKRTHAELGLHVTLLHRWVGRLPLQGSRRRGPDRTDKKLLSTMISSRPSGSERETAIQPDSQLPPTRSTGTRRCSQCRRYQNATGTAMVSPLRVVDSRAFASLDMKHGKFSKSSGCPVRSSAAGCSQSMSMPPKLYVSGNETTDSKKTACVSSEAASWLNRMAVGPGPLKAQPQWRYKPSNAGLFSSDRSGVCIARGRPGSLARSQACLGSMLLKAKLIWV